MNNNKSSHQRHFGRGTTQFTQQRAIQQKNNQKQGPNSDNDESNTGDNSHRKPSSPNQQASQSNQVLNQSNSTQIKNADSKHQSKDKNSIEFQVQGIFKIDDEDRESLSIRLDKFSPSNERNSPTKGNIPLSQQNQTNYMQQINKYQGSNDVSSPITSSYDANMGNKNQMQGDQRLLNSSTKVNLAANSPNKELEFDLYNRHFPKRDDQKSRSSRSNSSDDMKLNMSGTDFPVGVARYGMRNESQPLYMGVANNNRMRPAFQHSIGQVNSSIHQPLLDRKQGMYNTYEQRNVFNDGSAGMYGQMAAIGQSSMSYRELNKESMPNYQNQKCEASVPKRNEASGMQLAQDEENTPQYIRHSNDIELKPMSRQQAQGTLSRANQKANIYGLQSSSQLQDHYDSTQASPYDSKFNNITDNKVIMRISQNPLQHAENKKPKAQEQSSSLEDSYDPEVASIYQMEVDRQEASIRQNNRIEQTKPTGWTAEDYDQMFQESEKREQDRKEAERNKIAQEAILSGTSSSQMTTGLDIRREEEQLIARQRQMDNNQNVVVQMQHASAYTDYEQEVRGAQNYGKSRIGMRIQNTTSSAILIQSIDNKESTKAPKQDNKDKSNTFTPNTSKPSQRNNQPVNSGSLNNEQSRNYQEFMEKQSELQTKSSINLPISSLGYTTTSVQSTPNLQDVKMPFPATPSMTPQTNQNSQSLITNQQSNASSVSQNIAFVSNYGKQYMRDQQQQMEERRSQKLNAHVKKDMNKLTNSQLLQVQKQLKDREEKKKNNIGSQEMSEKHQYGEEMATLVTNFFEEEGRKNFDDRLKNKIRLDEASATLRQQNQLQMNDNYDNSSEDQNRMKLTESLHSRLLCSKQEENIDEREQEYGLSMMDTMHPNKFLNCRTSSPANYDHNEITNVRQNIFMQTTHQPYSRQPKIIAEEDQFSSNGAWQFNQMSQNNRQNEMRRSGNYMGQYNYGSSSHTQSSHHNSLRQQNQFIGSNHHYYGQNQMNQGCANIGRSMQDMIPNRHEGYGKVKSGMQNSHQQFNSKNSGQQYAESQAQKEKYYFYESHSRYISLHEFSKEYVFSDIEEGREVPSNPNISNETRLAGGNNFRSQSISSQRYSIYTNHVQKYWKQQNKILPLNEWFEQLLYHEKAISLTIVDSDIVALIQHMHLMYIENSHGYFGPTKDLSSASSKYVHSSIDADKTFKVGDYSIQFRSNKQEQQLGHSIGYRFVSTSYGDYYREKPYDYYGNNPPENMAETQAIKTRENSEDLFFQNLRIVKIGSENALTLSNDMLENTEFFLNQMQSIDPNFMKSELKIEKTEAKLAMSQSGAETRQTHSSASNANRKQGGRGARDSDVFFTLNERDCKGQTKKKVGQNATSAENFRARNSAYQNQGIKSTKSTQPSDKECMVHDDKSKLSLGQILSHLFEKAINVQYNDYVHKLNEQRKDFFFCRIDNNHYSHDMYIAKFWLNLSNSGRDQFWTKIEKDMHGILDTIKQHEYFKLAMNQQETIQEETNDAHSDSMGSDTDNKFKKIKQNCITGLQTNNDSQDTSSDDQSKDAWDRPKGKPKMSATKIGKRNCFSKSLHSNQYQNFDNDGRDYSNYSSSNDDEENRKTSQHYQKMGYIRLRGSSQEDESNSRRKAVALRKSTQQILKTKGVGHKALDSSHEGDTDEEDEGFSKHNIGRYNPNSYFEEDAKSLGRRLGISHEDAHHRMKSIYSSQGFAETQYENNRKLGHSPSDSDDHRYASNYDADEFDENTDEHEIDGSGDFELPADHSQNMDTNEPNIKQQITASKNQKNSDTNTQIQITYQNQKKYQSTGTGTDFITKKSSLSSLKIDNTHNHDLIVTKKKGKGSQAKNPTTSKIGGKLSKQIEEEKFCEQGLDDQNDNNWSLQANSKKSQIKPLQLNQNNRQDQNELKLLNVFKKQVQELKKLSHRPFEKSQIGQSNLNEIARLNKCYRFVRQVSTSTSFPERGNKCLNFPMLIKLIHERLHNAVYKLLESECKSNLDKDLESMEQEQHKKLLKNKPEGGKQVAQQIGATEVLSSTQILSKNQIKKNKKKNKKKKEQQAASENKDINLKNEQPLCSDVKIEIQEHSIEDTQPDKLDNLPSSILDAHLSIPQVKQNNPTQQSESNQQTNIREKEKKEDNITDSIVEMPSSQDQETAQQQKSKKRKNKKKKKKVNAEGINEGNDMDQNRDFVELDASIQEKNQNSKKDLNESNINLSSQAIKEQEEQKSHEDFCAEFEQDEDYQKFNPPIKSSFEHGDTFDTSHNNLPDKKLQTTCENKKMMEEIYNEYVKLNEQVIEHQQMNSNQAKNQSNQEDEKSINPKKDPKKSLVFVDLRPNDKQIRSQRTTWIQKSADYKEKAEEIVELDVYETNSHSQITQPIKNEQIQGQGYKNEEVGEKKRKQRKNKKKKKKNQDEGPSADPVTLQTDANQTIKEIENLAKKERNDPDNESDQENDCKFVQKGKDQISAQDCKLDRSDVDEYFDDEYWQEKFNVGDQAQDVNHQDINIEFIDGESGTVHNDICDFAKQAVRGAIMRADECDQNENLNSKNESVQLLSSKSWQQRLSTDLINHYDDQDLSRDLPIVPDANSQDNETQQKEQSINVDKNIDKNQSNSTGPQQPAVSRRRLEKQNKKKEAKQNAKLKQQQQKQEKEAQKAQKAQQRRETLEQQKLNKNSEGKDIKQDHSTINIDDHPQIQINQMNQESQKVFQDDAKQVDDVKLQMEIQQTILLKDVALPGLDDLGQHQQQVGRVPSHQKTVTKKSKHVQFKRDESYESSRIPKRGSSRGTSIASSTKNNKDDQLLSDFDSLFPQVVTDPQRSLLESFSENLNNNSSKKGFSPAGSIGNEEIALNVQTKNALKKLEDTKQRSRTEGALEGVHRGRSSSADRIKKENHQVTSSRLQQKSQSPLIETRNLSKNPLEVDIPSKKTKSKQKKQQQKEQKKTDQADKSDIKQIAVSNSNKKNAAKELRNQQLNVPQTSITNIIPQQIEIVRSEPPKPISKQSKKNKKGKQDSNNNQNNSQLNECNEKSKKAQKSQARQATLTSGPIQQDQMGKNSGNKKDDEKRKDTQNQQKQDKKNKNSQNVRASQQVITVEQVDQSFERSQHQSVIPQHGSLSIESNNCKQDSKKNDFNKDSKSEFKDSFKKSIASKAAKHQDNQLKNKTAIQIDEAHQSNSPQKHERIDTAILSQNAQFSNFLVNPSVLAASPAVSDTFCSSPENPKKQSVISNQRLQEILGGTQNKGQNQSSQIENHREESKTSNFMNQSNPTQNEGLIQQMNSQKVRKENRQFVNQSLTQGSIQNQAEYSQSQIMQNMQHGQFINQSNQNSSQQQVQLNSNNNSFQWPKIQPNFQMDQRNGANQGIINFIDPQRLQQPENVPWQPNQKDNGANRSKFEQPISIGNVNPIQFMANQTQLGNMAQQAQSGQNMNNSQGNQTNNSNSGLHQQQQQQQQQTQPQTQISIDFIRLNLQYNQVPVSHSQRGQGFDQNSNQQQRNQNQLCLPAMLDSQGANSTVTANQASFQGDNNALSQFSLLQSSNGSNQSNSTDNAINQMTQIGSGLARDNYGSGELMNAGPGHQRQRQGLQQQQPANQGNNFIQGSFSNLTINGFGPAMQAGAGNMAQQTLSQIGAHLTTSSGNNSSNNLNQNQMNQMAPMTMGMNMTATMSRMANVFQPIQNQFVSTPFQSSNNHLQVPNQELSSSNESNTLRNSASYRLSPNTIQNNIQAMMAQAQAPCSSAGTMGNLMNQAAYLPGNPLCQISPINIGLNSFNQNNNQLNTMSLNTANQNINLNMPMHPSSMAIIAGINNNNTNNVNTLGNHQNRQYQSNESIQSGNNQIIAQHLSNNLNNQMPNQFNQLQQIAAPWNQSIQSNEFMQSQSRNQGQRSSDDLKQQQQQMQNQMPGQMYPMQAMAYQQALMNADALSKKHGQDNQQLQQQQLLFNQYLQWFNNQNNQQQQQQPKQGIPGQQQTNSQSNASGLMIPSQPPPLPQISNNLGSFQQKSVNQNTQINSQRNNAAQNVGQTSAQSKNQGQGSKKNGTQNKNANNASNQLDQQSLSNIFNSATTGSSTNNQQLNQQANSNVKNKQFQGQTGSKKNLDKQVVLNNQMANSICQESTESNIKNELIAGMHGSQLKMIHSQNLNQLKGQNGQQVQNMQHQRQSVANAQSMQSNFAAIQNQSAPNIDNNKKGTTSMQANLNDASSMKMSESTQQSMLTSFTMDDTFNESNDEIVQSAHAIKTTKPKVNTISQANISQKDQISQSISQHAQMAKDSANLSDSQSAANSQQIVNNEIAENMFQNSAENGQAERNNLNNENMNGINYQGSQNQIQYIGDANNQNQGVIQNQIGQGINIDQQNKQFWHANNNMQLSGNRPSPQYMQMFGQYFQNQNQMQPNNAANQSMNPMNQPQLTTQQQFQLYAMQQQSNNKLQQLRCQGYILNADEYNMLGQNLTFNELQYVHEFYEVLDAQILKLQQDQETKLQKTKKLRQIAFNLIRDQIKGLYRQRNLSNDNERTLADQVKVEIYGSMETGLAIDSSDLDILVHDFVDSNSPRFHQMSRQELIEEMHQIHRQLGSLFALQSSQFIETAAIPVIKLQINLIELCKRENERDENFDVKPSDLELVEETKELNIDITLDEPKRSVNGSESQEHLGLQCCKYIKCRLDEYPKIKILALVFKKFLSLKDLNKPYSGGLSSYSLVQMILALLRQEEQSLNYLKQLDQIQLNCAQIYQDRLSVGMIFKHFIYEYGYMFDSVTRGIDKDGLFKPKEALSYIQHQQSCHINKMLQRHDRELDMQTVVTAVNELPCTCGAGQAIISQSHQQRNIYDQLIQGSAQDDASAGTGNLIDMLRGLLTKQPHALHNDGKDGPNQDNAGKYKRSGNSQSILTPQLIIVDPLNKYNNIGKSSYNFQVIQEELREVYKRLNYELIQFVRFVARGQQGTPQHSFQGQQQSTMQNSFVSSNASQTDNGNDPVATADMFDGLIPRILQIDYKIIQHESTTLAVADMPDSEQLAQPDERRLQQSTRQPKNRGAAFKKQQKKETVDDVLIQETRQEPTHQQNFQQQQNKNDKKTGGQTSKHIEDKSKLEENKQSDDLFQRQQSARYGQDSSIFILGSQQNQSIQNESQKSSLASSISAQNEQPKKKAQTKDGSSGQKQKNQGQGTTSGQANQQPKQQMGNNSQTKPQGQKKKGQKGNTQATNNQFTSQSQQYGGAQQNQGKQSQSISSQGTGTGGQNQKHNRQGVGQKGNWHK